LIPQSFSNYNQQIGQHC